MHQLFAASGGNRLQRFSATDGDQVEQAPACYVQRLEQFVDRGQVIHRFLRDEGIDLQRHCQFGCSLRRAHGPTEAALHAAHGFMPSGVRTVETEAETLDAVAFQFFEHGEGQIRSCARRDRNGHPQGLRLVDQIVHVRVFQRIAAGQNHMRERLVEARDLME